MTTPTIEEHTPEPWHIQLDTSNDVQGRLHTVWSDESPVGILIARTCFAPQSTANAKRIAQCVNACAGMVDPEKEIAELKDTRPPSPIADRLANALRLTIDYGIPDAFKKQCKDALAEYDAQRSSADGWVSVEYRFPERGSAGVDPGEGWRLIEPGELLQEGDEIWMHGGRWEKTGCRGATKCTSLAKYVYRRQIEKDNAQPPKGVTT